VAKGPQKVDVVEIFSASEAMSEVVVWVDVNHHFAADWAEEDEAAVTDF